jgi:hypothetical protein
MSGGAAFCVTDNVAAADEKQGPIFVGTEENDLFAGGLFGRHTDRHYTQGLKFLYLGGDDEVPRPAKAVADVIPGWGINVKAEKFGYDFGQNIYTPEDITSRSLITTDRPFAGWLYGGLVLQRLGEVGDARVPVMENFEINLGITGQPSLAEAIQENFHRWAYHMDIPKGWHNQLATEPGLLLKYQRLWRLSLNKELAKYVDLIPHIGGEVGNIEDFGNAGGTFRIGYNLPDDFGAQLNDSPASASGGMTARTPRLSFYGFAGVDGRYVAHNLFLDGNSFRSSPSVERNPWVADLMLGGAIRVCRHFEVSYMRVVRTTEFVGQNDGDRFGSITGKVMFGF